MLKFTSSNRRSKPSIALAIAGTWAVLTIAVPANAATREKPATAPGATDPQPAAVLERIKATGKITLGYRTDAAPMSYRDSSRQPTGYSVALCSRMVNALKSDLRVPSLAVEWVAVGSGFADVQERRVALICAADEVTQASREKVSFSIPIFPGGVSALVRADSPNAFQSALEERPKPYERFWRGTPPPTLENRSYSALVGSATMDGVMERMAELRMTASVHPVGGYEAGIAAVRKSQADVLFGDRANLLQGVQPTPKAQDLRVLTRHFTFVALALALPRNDDDFRLAVDRALSEVYADPQFGALYADNFGPPDADTVAFFRSVGVPVRSPVGPTK